MDKAEALRLLTHMRKIYNSFFIVPESAAASWAGILRDYSLADVSAALRQIQLTTDDPPGAHALKDACIKIRMGSEQQAMYDSYNLQRSRAAESFHGIPGGSRAEQILYVCAEQAARRWREGEQCEIFEDLLAKAKIKGFEFNGIDYDGIEMNGAAAIVTGII